MIFALRGMPLAALSPKTIGNYERIDIALLPPLPFLACGVDVVVVDGTKRHGELIADLQAQPSIARSARDARERASARR